MSLRCMLECINCVSATPAAMLFFIVAVILTVKTRFLQVRGVPYFFHLLKKGLTDSGRTTVYKTLPPFQALFTAMASTIGMGNLVVPAMAVYMGGPGALFWLLIYIFFGAATRYAEVAFAVQTRVTLADGTVIGGPMQYLKLVAQWLGVWYMFIIAFLYMSWSAIQSNTLALIYAQESVPQWLTGVILVATLMLVLQGGIKRVGFFASRLVPLMFVLYVTFGLLIILRNLDAFYQAVQLIISCAFSGKSIVSGLLCASTLRAMQVGIYQGIYITEAGLGTAAIAHSVADTNRPSDQGILAMFSMISDAFLSILSGVLVIITGVWRFGDFRSTFIYEAFKLQAPLFGDIVLLVTISLFVWTTIVGNTFNGKQSFALLTNNRWLSLYILANAVAIFGGSLISVKLIWEYIYFLLTLIAVPNVIGLVLLSYKYPSVLKLNREPERRI